MEMKPKPIYEILLKILKIEFLRDYEEWGIKSHEITQEDFDTWLVNKGYFEIIDTPKTEQK